MEDLLSASEIAALNLPGMPKSKVAIAAMAKREGWRTEERTGLGGVRRVYELPERFRSPVTRAEVLGRMPIVAIAGGTKADAELLAMAVQAVEEWCQETGRTLSPGRKGSVIAVLYDYLIKGGGEEDVKTLLQAVG
ncbi:DNA-binding protein [Massilia cellulosiltytica]|uniref:DNA-binding protein n=1 Tax=Massilia cellulosiltytica TaxID=2683234 RepID=UPI0039B52BB4